MCSLLLLLYPGDEARLSKCHQLLASIQDALTPDNLSILQPNLPCVLATLENAHRSIESALSSSQAHNIKKEDPDTSFKQTFHVSPGQKHDKQLKLYRTTQKCGRKRQGDILK